MSIKGLISGTGLTKVYRDEKNPDAVSVNVLRGVDVDIKAGEAVCIVGPSGAGKSTLLHILGTLDRPTSGKIFFAGQDLVTMSDEKLSEFRNRSMGFVFQFHHLLNEFSAIENVMMPALIAGIAQDVARGEAQRLLTDLGLGHRLEHKPSALSGGEQQRVAICRALVRKPAVLFADEPTGNLDLASAELVQNLLFDISRKHGVSLVTVTHDLAFARKFPKVLTIKDGRWAS